MKETLKLALEALGKSIDNCAANVQHREAIKALEEALAKQEQGEPDDLMIAYMSGLHDGKKLAKQEQGEPVAKYIGEGSEGSLVQLFEDVKKGTDFYTTSQPCQTCEALARTVMLDQSSHDTTTQQRKPLTDARLDDIYYCVEGGATPLETWREQARAIEAAHGIKEKNT